MDGKMYRMGMKDFKARIDEQFSKLDFLNDPEATDKQEELRAMAISCDALILFGRRHADEARKQIARIEKALAGGPAFKVTPFSGETQEDAYRRRIKELQDIIEVCTWIPENAPRTFREAVQMYWFCHLGTILGRTDVLVLPPRHDSGAQRLGRHEPRSFRPASGSFL